MTIEEKDILGRIEEKLDRVGDTLAGEVAARRACLAQQQEHHRTLYGPDPPGVVTRVERIEAAAEVLEHVRERGFSLFTAIAAAVAGSVATLAAGWLWNLVVH